jgi:hypothetical protein
VVESRRCERDSVALEGDSSVQFSVADDVGPVVSPLAHLDAEELSAVGPPVRDGRLERGAVDHTSERGHVGEGGSPVRTGERSERGVSSPGRGDRRRGPVRLWSVEDRVDGGLDVDVSGAADRLGGERVGVRPGVARRVAVDLAVVLDGDAVGLPEDVEVRYPIPERPPAASRASDGDATPGPRDRSAPDGRFTPD